VFASQPAADPPVSMEYVPHIQNNHYCSVRVRSEPEDQSVDFLGEIKKNRGKKKSEVK